MKKRIGWITSSYGRNVHFLVSVYLIAYLDGPERASTERCLSSIVWFFPRADEFPGTATLLKRKKSVSKYTRVLKFFYQLLSKLRLKIFIASTSDFDQLIYEFPHLKAHNLIDAIKQAPVPLGLAHENVPVRQLQNSTRPLVLIYGRNSDWDDEHYGVGSQLSLMEQYRNTSFNFIPALVETLIQKGFFVVRIGRDKVAFQEGSSFWNYAAWGNASDEIDFYLWSRACWMITSCGGADTPRLIFHTPTLFVNSKEPPYRYSTPKAPYKQAILPAVFMRNDSTKDVMNFEELEKKELLCKYSRKSQITSSDNTNEAIIHTTLAFFE